MYVNEHHIILHVYNLYRVSTLTQFLRGQYHFEQFANKQNSHEGHFANAKGPENPLFFPRVLEVNFGA